MAEVIDMTLEILKQIRDGIAQTNARLDQTREELSSKLDQTNSRLDQTNSRLDQTNSCLDQTNTRLDSHERILVRLVDEVTVQGKAIVKLIHAVDGINDRFDNFLTGAHHQDHEALRGRVAKLEDAVFPRQS